MRRLSGRRRGRHTTEKNTGATVTVALADGKLTQASDSFEHVQMASGKQRRSAARHSLFVCGHLSQFSRVPRTRSIWTDSYSPKRGYSNVPTPPRKGVGNRAASFRGVVDFPAERRRESVLSKKEFAAKESAQGQRCRWAQRRCGRRTEAYKEAARWRDVAESHQSNLVNLPRGVRVRLSRRYLRVR